MMKIFFIFAAADKSDDPSRTGAAYADQQLEQEVYPACNDDTVHSSEKSYPKESDLPERYKILNFQM